MKAEISRMLKLNVNTIKKAISRFQEISINEDRGGRGRKRTVNTTANRQRIKDCLRKNPRWPTPKLVKSTRIWRSTVQKIIKDKLHLKSYKLQEAYFLTDSVKAIRRERAIKLKRRFAAGRHRLILFTDEKLFTIEQSHNRQND